MSSNIMVIVDCGCLDRMLNTGSRLTLKQLIISFHFHLSFNKITDKTLLQNE